MDRVFLDANVLFSAAYMPQSRLLELWSLGDAEIVTSLFAVEEARRNLLVHKPAGIPILDDLVSQTLVAPGISTQQLVPDDVNLPEKDRPILSAAIESGCTHLLTGDNRHFGTLYGQKIGGVLILTPSQYLHRPKN